MQKQIAAQAEKQTKRAKTIDDYNIRVAKREAIKRAQPPAANLIQNAIRNSKARKAFASQKNTAVKYNEFLGLRDEVKTNYKSKAGNLTAKFGEALFPKAKVGRPAGSTKKIKQRTGAKTVLRDMVAKGKVPVGTPTSSP